MPKNLVVFDFDWSFVDQDTDRWVFEVLDTALRRKLQDRKSAGSQCMPDVVDQTMEDLFNAGYSREDVLGALRILPVHPAMKRAVTALKARGETDFLCLSNSNEVYIGTILEKHGLTNLFSKVVTNPARWDGDRLHIGRLVPADGPQHGCKIGCLPNMCKGDELDAWLAEHGGKESYDKILYVGDGSNDFCPLLRMRKGDVACVRKNMELHDRIKRDGEKVGLETDVELWDQAWVIDEIFSKL